MNTNTKPINHTPEFLSGGGEMGRLIREYDWSATSLGSVHTWPQSLRTCIRIMLSSRQPIWIGWGPELIKFYNDPYQSIVRGKHPWALGKPASVVWRDIWRDIEPMLQQVMEKGEGTYVESQLLIMERNGYPEETYYTFSYTPIPGDDGKIAGMFCANTDDTDRIISERQLRTLTQLGKSLLESGSNEQVYERTIASLKDNPQDFPFALFYTLAGNKAVLSSTTDLGEAKDKVPKEINLNSQGKIATLFRQALQLKKLQVIEDLQEKMGDVPSGAWQIPPDKAIILPITQSNAKEGYGFLVVGLNPYRLLDEKYSSFFSLVGDQIATSFADVHLLEEERKRAEALAEIDRAKTIFFSNISHEFRTPLTLMLGPIEDALQNPADTKENEQRIEVAYRNGLRLQKLVNTLLEFSRIEAGRLEGKFIKTDICTFTQNLASTFRSAIEKAGMQLIVTCSSIKDDVYVDTEMWEKIVLNLLSNAFKYSNEGSIEVGVKQVDKELLLTVHDTGVGIPEEHLDKIFDRFHRVEGLGGRSQEGTGIGLAMVKELVRLHGGTIDVKSNVGKGSTFTVSIPVGKDHLNEARIVEERVTALPSNQSTAFMQEALKWIPEDHSNGEQVINGQKNGLQTNTETVVYTVLLADDNADMREYIRRLLSTQYHVITTTNGEDAFEKATAHFPDLILSDVMMPKLDGFGLLKKLRQHSATKNIPLVFLSARAGEEAKVEGLQAGADDYIVKPFTAKELLARVDAQIKLRQSREKALKDLYNVFGEVPFAVAILMGEDLTLEFINQYNLTVWQREKEEVLGKPLYQIFPGNREAVEAVHREVYATGKRFTANEIPVEIFTNGKLETRWFNTVVDPLRNEQGQMIGQLASSIEVTEQVRARKEIERNEAELLSLANAMPQVVWIARSDGEVIYYNDRVEQFAGVQKLPDGNWRWEGMVHEADLQPTAEAWNKAVKEGSVYQMEHRICMKDGGYRWHLSRAFPQKDKDGNVVRWHGTATDIHDVTLAAEKIRESEERFRTLAESLPQLVWMTDNKGTQEYASKRWKEYTGVKPTGSETWQEIIHPDDLTRISATWTNSLSDGNDYVIEVRIKGKNGKYRWFYGIGKPIKDKDENVLKWVGAFTDIHDQKTLTEKLEQLVSERTKALQQSNEDLQQFAHVASHDLKEPVRKIKTFAGRLKEELGENISERSKVFLSKVDSATDRMFTMIDGVLTYSSANATAQEAQKVDLNDVIKNVEADLEIMIQQTGASIMYKNLPSIEGAPVLLHQLFYNLINNSIKFSKPDVPPVITIMTETVFRNDSDYSKIVLKDNGIGFDQGQAHKIFETFTRLHSKDRYEGTGLGLALCKKIVERHRGTIEAKGVLGEGAEFIITLPLTQNEPSV